MTTPRRTGAVYAGLTAKRYFRLFPVIAALTLALTLVLGFYLAKSVSKSVEAEDKKIVKIALAGDLDDSYLKIAVAAIKDFDMTKFSADFILMSEDEAKAKMRSGELAAYLYMPEGFMTKARHGEVGEIKYVTASGSVSFGTQLASELIKAVSTLVVDAQKATYGYEDVAMSTGLTVDETLEKAEDAVKRIVLSIVNRGELFDVEETGFAGSRTEEESIVFGVLTAFLSLWGICCCSVASKKDIPLYRSLRARGVGAAAQTAGEWGAYYVFMTVTVFLLGGVVVLALAIAGKWNVGDFPVARFAAGLTLPLATISAMQFFIYEITSGVVDGVIAQFLTAVGLGYITGCLFPSGFFPESVQRASVWLPTGAVRSYFAGFDPSGEGSGHAALILAGYAVLFLSLAFLSRRYKIVKDSGGAA